MRKARLLVALVAGIFAAACSDPLAPFQPEVSNVADNFQFQVTGLDGITVIRDYTWTNSGTSANVNQASSLIGGQGSLTIYDAQGTQVYAKDLTANGTFQTSAGTTGAWKIRVALSNARGSVNFRVQKP